MSVGQIIYFAKFEILPLASSEGIYNMVYTVLTALVGRFVLKESVSMRKVISLLLCVVGCLLIGMGLIFTVQQLELGSSNMEEVSATELGHNMTKESYITATTVMNGNDTFRASSDRNVHHRNISTETMSALLFGFLLCFVQAIGDCAALYCSSIMSKEVQDVLYINFWYLVMSNVVSIILMVIFEGDILALPTKSTDIIYVVVHGIASGLAHLALYALISFLSFIAITLFINAEILMKILCQYVMFPQLQPIQGGVFDLIGAIIIAIALVIPPLGELWEYRKDQENEHSEKSEYTPLAKNIGEAECEKYLDEKDQNNEMLENIEKTPLIENYQG